MKIKFLSVIFLLIGLFISCGDNAPDIPDDDFVVEKDEITTLYSISVVLEEATLRGSCYNKGVKFTEKGFFFATKSMNLNELASGALDGETTQYIVKTTEDGIFTHHVSDLTLGKRYFYIAYVKLSTGEYRFGKELSFLPDYLDITPADNPIASVVSKTYRNANISIELGGFGKEKLVGLDAALLRLYDVGVYLWKDETGSFENAEKISLNAGENTGLIKESSSIEMEITRLKGDSKYNIVPYLVIGVYRNYSSGVYLMEEVCGGDVQFTTPSTPLPEVKTLEASALTSFSAIISGAMLSDGGDEEPEIGFYVSDDESTLISEKNKYTVTLDEGAYSYFLNLSSLTFNTKYYYQAYIIASSEDSEDDKAVGYGDLLSFETLNIKKPTIRGEIMNYNYRYSHVTTKEATISFQVTEGMDPSLTSYGVKWGTDADNLTNDVAGLSINNATGVFTVALTSLTHSTTYYYRPYAKNAAGESDDIAIASFRTAVDGGKEWRYDVTKPTNTHMYKRMSKDLSSCKELVYHELNPIVSGNITYYLLDRNLNARDRVASSDLGVSVSSLSTEEFRQRIGGYYQWGVATPSITWEFPAGGNLNSYSWIAGEQQNYDTWQINPCPEGYDIPTKAQYEDMINSIKAATGEPNLNSLYTSMYFGATAFAAGNNGGRSSNTDASVLWTKDITNQTGALDCFIVSPSGAKITTGTPARTSCAPIRCVRVETTIP